MFGDNDSFEEMMPKIKKLKAAFVVIDSLDYMKMTVDQYKEMTETYPNKGFIIVAQGMLDGTPKDYHAKKIMFMVNLKTYARAGVVTCDSRHGETFPYIVFEKKERKPKAAQLDLFDTDSQTKKTA